MLRLSVNEVKNQSRSAAIGPPSEGFAFQLNAFGANRKPRSFNSGLWLSQAKLSFAPAAKTPPEKVLPPAFGIRLERTPLVANSADCEATSKTSSWTDISSVSIPMPPTYWLRPPSCIPLLMPST